MKLSWQFCAFGSAFFASLTAILAKIGVRGVDSNLATAIRTIVIMAFAWGIVAAEGNFKLLGRIEGRTWLYLCLSGLATGASWLFYFRALQLAPASKVAPIDKLSVVLTLVLAAFILKERIDGRTFAGALLVTIGAVILALPGRSAPQTAVPVAPASGTSK